MGIFSCPCCVSGWCWRVCGEPGELVKTFTTCQELASWQVLGAVLGELAILDNLYIKCYNKCNDDNKKAISHQTVKFTLQSVFPL